MSISNIYIYIHISIYNHIYNPMIYVYSRGNGVYQPRDISLGGFPWLSAEANQLRAVVKPQTPMLEVYINGLYVVTIWLFNIAMENPL